MLPKCVSNLRNATDPVALHAAGLKAEIQERGFLTRLPGTNHVASLACTDALNQRVKNPRS